MATTTRPEDLSSSSKRIRGPSVYQYLLPLVPAPHNLFSTLLSAFPSSLVAPQIEAILDELTGTITVKGEADMLLLWRQGFFGKGTLSRSEPVWRKRVENKAAELEGGKKRLTAEEATALRRIERKSTKLQKKLERDTEKLAQASAAASQRGSPLPAVSLSLAAPTTPSQSEPELDEDEETGAVPPEWHLTAERTHLQPEEAFFLLFSLGCLSLRPSTRSSPALSTLATWQRFLLAAPLLRPLRDPIDPRLSRLDSPFFLSYAVYHHYRSMGWVIRSGIKFTTDWVLYGPGGPVGGHAEFAVVVIPNYVDAEDEASNPFVKPDRTTWKWFNTVNRVCSGVKKTLVMLHVIIPPMKDLEPGWMAKHPAGALAKLEMREVSIRRWIAGRMRD